jgi:MoaA/NifB/PqqE/SkfB family radical SAM enzyme
MILDEVTYTKSGLLVREDARLGFIVFSPFTGLVFACQRGDGEALLRWLQGETSNAPSIEYEKALGPGWAISFREADYPTKHLLPSASSGWSVPCPDYPIIINWLLTGNCALECDYCYAEDLMRGKYNEPNVSAVDMIAESILSYHPLAVVLTGGDPLLSPHLERVLSDLYRRTGIIIDTSGFNFTPNHLKLFREYGLFVRISLDSEIPSIHDSLRHPKKTNVKAKEKLSSSAAAMHAISECLDAGISVSVQTVATKHNRSDLEAFGDKLYKLGVRSWRILIVAPATTNMCRYEELKGTKSGQERFNKYIEKQLRSKHENGWNKVMAVQITHNRAPNSVILVSPDGTFLTEASMEPKKIILDEEFPKHPRLECIFSTVDKYTHAERYLSL